jgi:hypothetical protein
VPIFGTERDGLSVVEACRWISNSMVGFTGSLNISFRQHNHSRFDKSTTKIDIDWHLSEDEVLKRLAWAKNPLKISKATRYLEIIQDSACYVVF